MIIEYHVQPISIRNISFQLAWRHHYSKLDSKLTRNLVRANGKRRICWRDASIGRNRAPTSCAIRVSVALTRAGVNFAKISEIVKNKWFHTQTKETYLGRAVDFWNAPILENGENIIGNEEEKRKVLKGRKGLIYFGDNGNEFSGHLTLWNGKATHFEDDYFYQPICVFWEMAT